MATSIELAKAQERLAEIEKCEREIMASWEEENLLFEESRLLRKEGLTERADQVAHKQIAAKLRTAEMRDAIREKPKIIELIDHITKEIEKFEEALEAKQERVEVAMKPFLEEARIKRQIMADTRPAAAFYREALFDSMMKNRYGHEHSTVCTYLANQLK
jgi:uncharacterized protein (DUF342 family)